VSRAASYIAFRFSVVGSGYFPLPMLAWDRCAPLDADEAIKINSQILSPSGRTIALVGHVPRGWTPQPTASRWESFGWRVVPGTVKRIDL
jgi:hypothetical protein